VEPVPETRELLSRLLAVGDTDLPDSLLRMGEQISKLVPECVGLSLSIIEEGLTLTLVASDAGVAGLDAVQYVDDGPCLAAIEAGEPLDCSVEDLLDEGRWLMYAQVSAAVGVASSLSMPIMVEGEVVGGVNLYGSTPDAFHDRHEEIARVLGTAPEGAVSNADLSFSSRLRAAEAPHRFDAEREIEIAVEVIAARRGLTLPEARERLRCAAAQAGITDAKAARAFRHLLDDAP
jgi:GAF domain-containing protein